MFYSVYQVTNTINNKIYIGTHITSKVEDDYMGSGTLLKRAMKKYGISNFIKEILFVFDTPEAMFAKEAELVNEEFLKRDDVYNVMVGGFGGWDYVNSTGLAIPHGNKYAEKAWQNNPKRMKEVSVLGGLKTKKKSVGIFAKEFLCKPGTFTGKQHSTNTKTVISNKMKIAAPARSMRWIFNDIEKTSKYVKTDVVEEFLSNGWKLGRKKKF